MAPKQLISLNLVDCGSVDSPTTIKDTNAKSSSYGYNGIFGRPTSFDDNDDGDNGGSIISCDSDDSYSQQQYHHHRHHHRYGADSNAEDDDMSNGMYDVGRQQQRHTTIRFAVAVKKHIIISREDYTEEEWSNCFCTDKEERKSAKKRLKVVARMEKGKKPKKGMSYRGLECSTEAGQKKFDTRVRLVIDAVMDEQDHQWYETQMDDCESIAQASINATRPDVEKAIQTGLQDEIDASPDATDISFNDSMTSLSLDDETVFTCMTPVKLTSPQRLNKKMKKKKDSRRNVCSAIDPPGERASIFEGAGQEQHTLPLLSMTQPPQMPIRRGSRRSSSLRDLDESMIEELNRL